jgi:membrane protease YdiL (CAAX protease family)
MNDDIQKSKLPLSLRTALALLLAGWGLSLLISPLVSASFISGSYYKTALGMILLELVFLLPVCWYLKKYKPELSLRKTFKLHSVNPQAWPGIMIFSAGIIILGDVVDRIFELWVEIPGEYVQAMESLKWSSPGEAVIMTFAVVCVAAFVEELIFRGMLIKSMEDAFKNPPFAIIMSSIFFALVHSLPWYFFQIFILGLILGALSSGFRSVWPAVFLHGAYNFFSLILLNSDVEPSWYIVGGHVRHIWIIVAGTLVWIGILMIRPWYRPPKYRSLETEKDLM